MTTKSDLPKSIRIIGKDYKIEPIEDTSLGTSDWGRADHFKQKLSYLVDQTPQQLRDTMLHEVIHAIEYGVKLDLSERDVHALSAGICQVLWDNPEFSKWLMRNH